MSPIVVAIIVIIIVIIIAVIGYIIYLRTAGTTQTNPSGGMPSAPNPPLNPVNSPLVNPRTPPPPVVQPPTGFQPQPSTRIIQPNTVSFTNEGVNLGAIMNPGRPVTSFSATLQYDELIPVRAGFPGTSISLHDGQMFSSPVISYLETASRNPILVSKSFAGRTPTSSVLTVFRGHQEFVFMKESPVQYKLPYLDFIVRL